MQFQRLRQFAIALALALSVSNFACADDGVQTAEKPGAIPAADALFRAGKEQLALGNYTDACALFERSYAEVPGTGCLLALAFCYESAGKLASAHRAYLEVATRSETEDRSDRAQAARQKLDALRPRLSTLTVHLAEPLTASQGALVITVDDETFDASQLDRPIPLNGGVHRLVVRAGDRGEVATEVTMNAQHDAQTVTIVGWNAQPLQETSPPPAASPPPPTASKASAARARAPVQRKPWRKNLNTSQWLGIGSLAVGTGGLVASLVYTLSALRNDRASKPECLGNACTREGRSARFSARRDGNFATGFLIGGATLATAGVVALVIGTKKKRHDRAPQRWQAGPLVAPGKTGVFLEGTF